MSDLEFKELGSVVDSGEENYGNEVTEERLWVRHLKIPEHKHNIKVRLNGVKWLRQTKWIPFFASSYIILLP